MRHPDTLKRKSKTHAITQTGEASYTVTSGTSGKEYTVNILPDGGGTCSCDWATWRQMDEIGRSGCSHVLSVIAYRAALEGRRIAIHTGWESAGRQHRHTENIGDELVITTRKAG